MTATVARIESKQKHPNADALFIYTLSNEFVKDVQVIANQENIYQVGDYVVYIHPKSVLLENDMKVGVVKLRGVKSCGMLMGLSNKPLNTDLTEEFCKPESKNLITQFEHQKWPSIESFAHVKRTANTSIKLGNNSLFNKFTYAGKVKLHGTNAAVQIAPNGEVVAQKRSSLIYPENDNYGFAKWVQENQDAFKALASKTGLITLHGEWCGGSIQKGVALNQVKKVFAIFALQVKSLEEGRAEYCVDPEEISLILGEGPWYILPWHHAVDINFTDDLSIAKAANEIEKEVLKVEECDPWVKHNFNIEGGGEGIVYYPMVVGFTPATKLENYIFKCKGYSHQVNCNKKPNIVNVDVEKAASIQEFANMFVTENRLLQGVEEACEGRYDRKLTSNFLSWIAKDIQKEGYAELKESNLTWKDVSSKAMTIAREWYLSKS